MRNTTKRLLSLVMVIALMLTLAPLSVFAAGSTKTVCFQNNWKWTDVRIHYWTASSGTTWPGEKMTFVETDASNGNDIYKFEIPADAIGIIFNGIKNDGSGTRDQSPDIKDAAIKTGVCYYMDWDGTNNKNAYGSYAYTLPGGSTDSSSEPSSDPSSEPSSEPSNPGTGLTGDFYLIGYINGANYGDADDHANLGDYKFVNGQVTVTFTQTSYVCVKTADMVWYMTDGWLGEVTSAKLYSTQSGYTPATKFDKLMVPAGTATFTLADNGDGTYTLSYTTDGSGGDVGGGDVGGGDEEGGSDVDLGGTIPTGDYYLFGWINGADYGTGDDYATLGQYKFVNGSVTATFPSDSYVGVKNAAMTEWFQTKGWQGAKTAVVLQNSQGSSDTDWDKMFVPGGVELTFSLRQNADGTMTLSYVRNEVKGVQDTSGIQAGVTLHCWNWSYNNIAANMEAIANAGYTAIQTSPAQGMKEDTVGVAATKWWLFYQPVDFKMNTSTKNALGTKAEFTAMCEVADQYGIKVIVDVVANHLGNKTGNNLADLIPDYLRNDAYWHDITTNTENYNDRYDITQHCMSGLPDLNTANKDVQNYVLAYLKECIDAGADGFRFDATKHIETPYDDSTFASDFWPTVIGGAEDYAKQKGFDLYCYGELLDTPDGETSQTSIIEYTEFLAVTDNSWGNQLRGEIAGGTASYNLKGYNKVATANQLVLWAESHDTYGNDDKVSTNISVANINKTWALVAARGDAMGLYFARPANFASDTLGMGGTNTGWANPEVVAVNKFHNAFDGESEKSGNSGGVAYVVRGDSGIVLVNYQGTSKTVSDLNVGMADGTYTDQVSNTTFTVTDGKISGSIGATGIAVVYNVQATHEHSYTSVVTDPTCTEVGYTTYTCECTYSYVADEVAALGHNYVDGACTRCGAIDPACAEYYLFGYINGADYGTGTDYENLGEYKFVDGTVTATFARDSYVGIKTDAGTWYMTDGWQGKVSSVTLYDTAKLGEDADKLYVPGNADITFTMERNEDGTVTLSYTAVPRELFDINAAQVELGNALNLYFLFPVDSYMDWSGCYAEVTKTYADGRDNVTVTVAAEDWEDKASGGKQYKKIGFHNISAKEMADEISIVVYNADKQAISNPYTDSIVGYLERMLGKNSNAEFRALAVDMLNYGAAAQTQFKYNLDNLANANIDDYQQYGTAADAVCANNQVKGDNVRGASVSLENNIIMNVYFVDQTADMTAEVTFKNHAGTDMTVVLTSVDTSNGYCFQIDNLAVADMRTMVTITCKDADGNVYGTLTDSVEGYVARTGATKAINQAIMKFSDSAYAYLH